MNITIFIIFILFLFFTILLSLTWYEKLKAEEVVEGIERVVIAIFITITVVLSFFIY